MNLRFWLKRNFLRRGLLWLSQTALQRLFSGLRLPSLFPAFERVFSISEDGVAGGSSGQQLQRDTRQLHVVCDQKVRLDIDYVERTAPLHSLSGKVTDAELKTEIESLAKGDFFFPGDAYLKAVKGTQAVDVILLHRCRVRPSVSTPADNALNQALAHVLLEPAVFLIYNSPVKRPTARRDFSARDQTVHRNKLTKERPWQNGRTY
jgi:hypothetical protein